MRRIALFLWIAGSSLVLAAQSTPPTFNKEVVRIFQANCQTCHHPGDIAPFSLMDYQSARPWARDIQDQVVRKIMPPWKPSQDASVFTGARILSQADINTISAWVDAGAPEGNAADLPTPLTFDGSWALGAPDLTLKMPSAFAIYGSGTDIYRCFSIATNLPADTWVNAIQILPGNPAVDHHVVLYSDPTGQSQALDKGNGYPCFGDAGIASDPSFFGAWAPGFRPSFLAPGTAMSIKKGSYIAMQVHYHPNGVDTTDQSTVGIYFAKGPIDKTVYFLPLVNTSFTIPAGQSHYQVTGGGSVGALLGASHLVAVAPHMHLLGTESHVTLVSGKTTTPLIDINSWDFNWQGVYNYVTPVPVPSNGTVQFTKYYDNSVNNPKNPNSPPVPVSWGEQTTDEMAVVFLGGTQDSQHLINPTFSSANVVNAASFASGPVAPGSIVSLFGLGLGSNWGSASGTVPTTLANITINFSGVSRSVPLFYASPSQVNFQVPFEANSASTLTLVRGDDNAKTSVSLTVGNAQPGLFSADSSGTGPAAAQLADGTQLSATNPVARGGVAVLYATGMGRTTVSNNTGMGSTGLAPIAATIQANIGGRPVTPQYAGLTPGFVGLYQVNLPIPSDLTPGDVPVKVTVAGVDSNTVTISVK